MLSWAPNPTTPGRTQKGRVNIPKTDGSALARPKIAAVMIAPIPQNSRTLLMVDGDILLDYTLPRPFRTPLLIGFPEGRQILYARLTYQSVSNLWEISVVPQFEILIARTHSQIPKPIMVQHIRLRPIMFCSGGFDLPSSTRKNRNHP